MMLLFLIVTSKAHKPDLTNLAPHLASVFGFADDMRREQHSWYPLPDMCIHSKVAQHFKAVLLQWAMWTPLKVT